jgi:hypothetical protein
MKRRERRRHEGKRKRLNQSVVENNIFDELYKTALKKEQHKTLAELLSDFDLNVINRNDPALKNRS